MNGYTLTRGWYNYKFENNHKVKAIHSDMYFYIIDLRNRLGQKENIGLPTSVTMECLGIGSYNTYNKVYQDLLDFGFIKEIQKSKNQHSSRIIAISKYDKATDKALDKATIKATDKATDTINKQQNNGTIEQENNKENILDSFSFLDIEVKNIFIEFVNRRKKNEKNFEDSIITRLYNRLNGFSNNKTEQIEIIEKSLISNWKDFFPLKSNQYKTQSPQEQKSKFTTEADAEKLLFSLTKKGS